MFKKLNESFKEKINKPLLILAFIIFLTLLVWVIIFKFNNLDELYYAKTVIIEYNFQERFLDQFNGLKYKDINTILELIFNILIFIPLTLYLPLLFKNINFKRDIIISFLITLCFESFQLLVGLGGLELIDIAMNVLGAIIGYFIFKTLKPFTSDKIINYINLVTVIIFFPLMVFAITNTIIHYEYYIPFFDGTGIRNLFIIH